MKCMYCGCKDSRVIDSRMTEEGMAIRRRRECENCQKRFTTYEKIEYTPVLVVKKDGRREEFDAAKLKQSILKACANLPLPIGDVDALVSDIEKNVSNSLVQEISSKQIGEMVMAGLKELDEVAYVRFASVYREFKDINTFMEELKKLLSEND